MKLLFAATVAALANQASAFKVVVDNEDNGYCLMVVKNNGSTNWATDTAGNINGLPTGSTVTTDKDGSPTIAQNGVNDPTDAILTAARTAFTTFISDWTSGPGASPPDNANNLSVTVYEAGGATALSTLLTAPTPSGTLDWCKAYSTMAPDHYCVADGNVNMSWQGHTLKSDIQTCCANNHGGNTGMENTCLEVSTGVKARGNAEWYISSSNDKCVRNCDTTNLFDPASDTNVHADTASPTDPVVHTQHEFECGGLLTWQTSYASLDTCCSTHFSDLIPEYCDYLSEVGSQSSGVDAYAGTLTKWYSDASNSICKKDCAVDPGGDATCGGVITKSYITLYDNSADCCSAELSWVSGCETRSASGEGEPTDLYWPDPSGCRKDCTVGDNCASAPSTAKIYATDEECCKLANSWVNLEYCKTRADPGFPASGGSDKWYVSYENGVCRQDCNTAGVPKCELADNGSLTFFDSASSCCKALLGSNDEDACTTASEDGLTISTVATNKWYVSTSGDQPCAQDCATGTTNAACGGIVAKTGVRLYDTVTECCDQAYGWLNEDLCEKESENTDEATNLWYVDYGANACKKDCTVGSGSPVDPACNGRPDDTSTPMYTTADLCCAAKLNWIDKDTCVSSSTTGVDPTDSDSPGTGEWRKNSSWSACVLDCTDGDTIADGDPILVVQPVSGTTLAIDNDYPEECDGVISDSSAVFYDASVENCCKSINWVQEETCVSISTDTVSEMFFADPSERTKCLAHQEAGGAASGTGGIACSAAGAVTAPTDAAGVTCEDTITTSTKLYSSLEDCCEANVNWDKDGCIHDSKGTEATGTNEWYVDWSLSQCVQDCPTASVSSCGGLAKAWDVLYKDSSSCCNRLSWLSKSKCVYYNA